MMSTFKHSLACAIIFGSLSRQSCGIRGDHHSSGQALKRRPPRRSLGIFDDLASTIKDQIGEDPALSVVNGFYDEDMNEGGFFSFEDSVRTTETGGTTYVSSSDESEYDESFDGDSVDNRTGEKKKGKKKKRDKKSKKSKKKEKKRPKKKKEKAKSSMMKTKGKKVSKSDKKKQKGHEKSKASVKPVPTSHPSRKPTPVPSAKPVPAPTPKPTKYKPAEYETGNSKDSSIEGNLVAIDNRFALQYTTEDDTIPTKAHYTELAILTARFINSYLTEYFEDIRDVDFAGFNIDKLTTPSSLVVQYQSGAAFDDASFVPSESDMDELIAQVFRPNGTYLELYISHLKGLSPGNPFRKTTGVTMDKLSNSLVGPDVQKGTNVKAESSDPKSRTAVLAVSASVAGLTLLIVAFVVSKRLRREKAFESVDTTSEGRSTSRKTFSSPMYEASSDFTSSDFTPKRSNISTIFATPLVAGEESTEENVLHVLREADMASVHDDDDELVSINLEGNYESIEASLLMESQGY